MFNVFQCLRSYIVHVNSLFVNFLRRERPWVDLHDILFVRKNVQRLMENEKKMKNVSEIIHPDLLRKKFCAPCCLPPNLITLVEKKCFPYKDLARISQDNAFSLDSMKEPCKVLASNAILVNILQDYWQESIKLFPCKVYQGMY